jgi:hypothetical protein|tara:strand:+ start:192 stop:413 length:222 start_codon:yes stop_codon:yes gene_type:complete
METNKTRRTLVEFQRQHFKGQTFLQFLHELKNDILQFNELSSIKTKVSFSNSGGEIAKILSKQMLLLGQLIAQ